MRRSVEILHLHGAVVPSVRCCEVDGAAPGDHRGVGIDEILMR